MGKCLKLCVLALACAMGFGCAAKNNQHYDYSSQAEQRFRRSYEAAFDSNEQKGSQQLLRKARSAIGTPYVPGGMSPGGFDCSGFVCWAYKSVGVNLPRTAQEQSVIGKRINNVEDMQVGDIVAFRHPRRGYHTGIYVGDGKFIHSPHRRTTVRINSLDDPYFKGTFLGARRVKMDGTENLVAEAESRLNDYAEEKAVRDIYRSRKPSHTTVASDEHGKKSKDRGKDTDRSKDKDRSKSHDKFVEVASLDKKNSANRKIEVEKAGKSSDKSSVKSSGKSSEKSSDKSSVKEDKSDKKSHSSAAKSGSSKSEPAKSEHKSENRKQEPAKADAHKSEGHKTEAAKSDSKSGSSKSSAAKSEPSKKGKADSEKVASKSDHGKEKKTPAKNRDNNS